MRPLAVVFALVLGVPALAADDVTGTWLAEDGTSQIRIAPCGGARCATIVWTNAESARDVKNPSPSLRSRPIVGVRLISDARPDKDGWTGSLYNPLDGQTYTGKLRRQGASLELSGCVMNGLFCRAQTWTAVK